MRKLFLVLIAMLAIASCDKKPNTNPTIAKIPAAIEVERFDKLFFETEPKNLPQLKKQYPFFFPKNTPDSVWLEKMQNPLWRELYTEVQKKYSNFEPAKKELSALFQKIKIKYPNTSTPKIITVIAEMDYNNKVIYTDSLLIISLELYLGKNHKFYQFPNYIKQNFEQNQILPDVVASIATKKITPPTDLTFLSQMVYFGKQLYLKDALLPDYSDANKIGYTEEQNKWCDDNQAYIWRYFIDNEMLYSTDQKLGNRFINLAPFSKFYLEIDNESPGRVGVWIGWQIVRSFMKNNDVSLEKMFQMNAKEIFEKSRYKPKKNDQ